MANIKEKRARIRNVKDTTENWERANPILLDGELGVEVKDNGMLATKMGDGITPWNRLSYYTKPMAEIEMEMDDLQKQIDDAALSQINYITPETYGAKGDGVTDDSVAIQAAISEAISIAEAAGNAYYLKPIVYLGAKTYKVNTGIVLESRCLQFHCDGEIVYDGTDSAISIKHSLMNIYINIIKAPNGTALYLTGSEHQCVTNNIKVNRIEESIKGVYLRNYGEANSMFYNRIDIGPITSTEICVLLSAEKGYINENHFWLGRLSGAETGIKIYSDPIPSGTGANSNRFFKGSFEDLANTDKDDSLMADINTVALWLENTGDNTFANFRCDENYGRTNVKFVGDCSYNDIGLSSVQLGGVDTTELTSGGANTLRGSAVRTGDVLGGGYTVGDKALVSYAHGVTYDPIYANIWYEITSESFTNNVIRQIYNENGNGFEIPTTFTFDNSVNGSEFTLGSLFSETGSLCRGFPLVLKFGATSGRILLKDYRGGIILDNTDGKYADTSISVKWNGYDKVLSKHIWDIQKLGIDRENVDNKVTELSVSSNDEQYPTARCVYNAIKANEPKELDFAMKEGTFLVITSKVKNLVTSSVDTDGSIYKGGGYADGYRINSSGNQVEQSGTAITGWMDCEGISDADTIYVKGLEVVGDLHCGIAFYDKDFVLLQCLRLETDGNLSGVCGPHQIAYTNSAGSSVTTNADGVIVIKVNFREYEYALTPPKYFRIFAKGNGSDAIVTRNVEIKASEDIVVDLGVPTKTSELQNDSGFLTSHQDISGKANKADAETWTFTLADGNTVTKKVVLA